jgi:NAD(P)-dependent dehydrogenase (short-subunit alcohol dehydrogenase family)
MDFKDKVVIVTGASSGIGQATAREFYQKGAKVVLAARSIGKLKALSKDLPGSLVSATDMTAEIDINDMVNQTVDHFGRLDILINNAGQGYDATIVNIDRETLQHIFELDFYGPLFAMQKAIPIMKKQGGGAIVNVSSGTALMHIQGMGAYAAIKAAIAHLSLTAREELAKDSINVGVVYPYITKTDFEVNTIKHGNKSVPRRNSGNFKLPDADPPEYVAKLILDCVESNLAEVYAHDWMNRRE